MSLGIKHTPKALTIFSEKKKNRQGLTLIEVMIATVLAVLLMMTLASAFKRVGDSIAENRAGLEMSNRLRSVSSLLRRDLEMATARNVTPPMSADSPMGYLKYFEGPMCDFSARVYVESSNPATRAGRFGDYDDILMLTACSPGEWFTGRVPRYIAERKSINDANYGPGQATTPTIISSKYAEIIWFVRPVSTDASNAANFDVDNDQVPDKLQLHRRVLLIRPDLNQNGVLPVGSGTVAQALQFCDLSMRSNGTSIIANSIEDTMYLENRFAHIQLPVQTHLSMPILDLENAVPFAQGATPFGNLQNKSGLLNSIYMLTGDRLAEDVVMSDCVAFDLKVFDPDVPLYRYVDNSNPLENKDILLSPNDPGYWASVSANVAGRGDFVDIGWYRTVAAAAQANGGTAPPPVFFGFSGFNNSTGFEASLLKSGMVVRGNWSQMCYDTWTTGYELDSRLQGDLAGTLAPQNGTVVLQSTTAGRSLVDIGFNGVDDDQNGLIDDVIELETSAPFPLPLQSLKATIRLEEPDTRQLQQMSVLLSP